MSKPNDQGKSSLSDFLAKRNLSKKAATEFVKPQDIRQIDVNSFNLFPSLESIFEGYGWTPEEAALIARFYTSELPEEPFELSPVGSKIFYENLPKGRFERIENPREFYSYLVDKIVDGPVEFTRKYLMEDLKKILARSKKK